MDRPGINLPDFSRGETFVEVGYPSFEPLFAGYTQSAEFSLLEIDGEKESLAGISSAMADLDGMDSDLSEQVAGQEENSLPVTERGSILSDLAKHHADEIDELVRKHQQEVLQHLEDLQLRFIGVAVERIEAALADVLKNLFQDRLTETCIKKLTGEVNSIVQRSTIDRMQISGPPELTSAIFGVLPNVGFPIEVEESDGIDLTLSFNEKSISTNVGDWMKQLEKALS